MSKLNFENIQEDYEVALAEKENNFHDVSAAIIDNNLVDKFIAIQKERGQIQSLNDLDKYQKEIESFFYEVYKIITAPGVQKFVDWLNDLTSKGLDTKTNTHITDFLIKNYASFDDKIKNIIKNKDVLEPNNSLFENIKKSVRENINKRIQSSLSSKEKINDELSDFINDLDDLLQDISEIKELSFQNVKDFYTNNLDDKDTDNYKAEIDQITDYFYDLIKKVVEKKDFLTTDKDKIQLSSIVANIQNSINDIKKSITVIKTIEVTTDSDDIITTFYNKFEQSFKFNNVENVSDYIEESIKETWDKTISAYNTCQNFYSEFNVSEIEKLKNSKDKWMEFEFAKQIDNYISNIEIIITEKPIDYIQLEDISKINSRFVEAANKIGALNDNNPKEIIVEYFSNITSDFEGKKIEILKKLKTDVEEIEKIKKGVEEINNFIENINKSENLLDALNDEFVNGILGSYNYVKDEFTSAIERSDIKDDLDFLYDINSDEWQLNKSDLEEYENLERFKRLLEYDLINLTLTKNI